MWFYKSDFKELLNSPNAHYFHLMICKLVDNSPLRRLSFFFYDHLISGIDSTNKIFENGL